MTATSTPPVAGARPTTSACPHETAREGVAIPDARGVKPGGGRTAERPASRTGQSGRPSHLQRAEADRRARDGAALRAAAGDMTAIAARLEALARLRFKTANAEADAADFARLGAFARACAEMAAEAARERSGGAR